MDLSFLACLYEGIGAVALHWFSFGSGLGFRKLLMFYVKVFLCDGQITVRQAILYTDGPCLRLANFI